VKFAKLYPNERLKFTRCNLETMVELTRKWLLKFAKLKFSDKAEIRQSIYLTIADILQDVRLKKANIYQRNFLPNLNKVLQTLIFCW